jgi:hypothetical protein
MFVFVEWYANIFNKKPRGQVVPSLVSRESLWVLGREGFSLSETLINISWLIVTSPSQPTYMRPWIKSQ